MAEERRCPQCGAKLPADAPQGLCPQCLMKLGLAKNTEADTASVAAGVGDVVTLTTPMPGAFVPPAPEELAKHLPQLEILELLGQGGMGAVYKARQPALDRFVAVKILPRNAEQDAAFAERFTREARSLAKLSHPKIVTVYDFGRTADGLYYIVMEFVEGPNLRQVIQAGTLSPAEALGIVPQICDALQYAHEEGIVHRDIKPENILLDTKGRVKIADFGLAKLLDRPAAAYTLTQAGQVMGTPHYMAPEQTEKPLEVDHRADIFSLGVVFYEMLTGELPLGRFAPPSQKVQVDVRLDEVVLRSLEKEPDLRYQQVSEVKTDLENLIGRTPPQAVQRQVRAPAIGLLVASAVSYIILLMYTLGTLAQWEEEGLAVVKSEIMSLGPTLLTGMALSVPVTAFMILAGIKMMNLSSYRMAITGSVLALLPCGPATVIGFPAGIWCLWVLSREEIKLAFARKRKQQEDARGGSAVGVLGRTAEPAQEAHPPSSHAGQMRTEPQPIGSTSTPSVPEQTSKPLSPFLAFFWEWPHPGKKYFGGLAIIVVSLAVGILLLQSEVSGVPFLEWMSFAFLLGAIGSVYALIPYRRWADGRSGRGIQVIRVSWGMGLLFLAGGSTNFIRNLSALLDVTEWYALTGASPGQYDMRVGGLFTLVTFAWTMLFFMRARQPFRGLEKPNRWGARQWNISLAIWVGALVFIGGVGGFKIYFPRFVQERTASGTNMEDIEKAAALTQEGWALLNAQKWTPAQKTFEEALRLDPEAPNALSGLGFILLNTGKAKEAKAYFEKCLAVEPLHLGALNGMARSLKEGEGKIAEAIAIWEKMVEQIPGPHAGTQGLAWTYLEQGEHQKAIDYFEQILEANPKDANAKQGLDRARNALDR